MLRHAGCSTTSKMEALYCTVLRWSVGKPPDMHAAVLHFITDSIPLHGLILKHTVRYYGTLEHDKAAYCAVEEALATAATQDHANQLHFHLQHLHQPRWAAGLVQSAVEEISKEQCCMHHRKLTTLSIKGLVELCMFHSLDPASTSVQWIYQEFA